LNVDEQVLVAQQLIGRSTDLKDSIEHRTALEGELLPGWADEWVVLERERLRQVRLHALEMLAERLAGARRFDEAVEAAFAVLKVDPLRESTQRVLIETYLAEGNRAQAIWRYHAYRNLLKSRLKLEPAAGPQESDCHQAGTGCY
jgi:DNA-binding SARP family transcriptional activator